MDMPELAWVVFNPWTGMHSAGLLRDKRSKSGIGAGAAEVVLTRKVCLSLGFGSLVLGIRSWIVEGSLEFKGLALASLSFQLKLPTLAPFN